MQKCTEPLHNHHDGCPVCIISKTEIANLKKEIADMESYIAGQD